MFKIRELTMFDMNGMEFTYKFNEGINYFKGKNSSGKTEFYLFIDFMFGSSEEIIAKPWYRDSLSKATMIFEYNGNNFSMTRTRNSNQNYLHYIEEKNEETIDLREYRNKLNSIFAQDKKVLQDIRNFTNEELTYRAFTMFNFLGEKGQGKIQDFLDKCSDIKYSVKLNPILNFIFNNNLEQIHILQNKIEDLLQEIKELENEFQKYNFVVDQVNKNLQKLGGNIWFTGKNSNVIVDYISSIVDMHDSKRTQKKRNISDLEVMYSNLSEQIKVYENNKADAKQFERDNENRRKLLTKLHALIDENEDFYYLVEPMQNLLNNVDNTILFSSYLINDNTVKELKSQREKIKTEIRRNDSRFKVYNLEDKSKAIALIKEYLSIEIVSNDNKIKKKTSEIKKLREELKALQNSDDNRRIDEMSSFTTKLYYSAKDISSVVSDDIQQKGFEIRYLKKGNILQPMILSGDSKSSNFEESVNFYIGSMARHTLIQLCGYLAFLKILLENNEYPIIPILVIDHISKPFDAKNSSAIGQILSEAYKTIGKENLQIFIFDDEDSEVLDINQEYSKDLVTEYKTGFNPFFFPPTANNPIK
ncbi:hypothetical protein BKP56_05475 [Marinilactibacillus sp. 15R]|uniref:hypothetical protein n=1 Tax=Marinilactibacillus sp. 15R TaxID=1911586 RepID=UPI000909AF79|nr:hypothetical protein [Marinilactibacillus sp. 15R]API88771.1 hypothetical protein BKP56_05475 [Marinilactibacillus sp. 15R]